MYKIVVNGEIVWKSNVKNATHAYFKELLQKGIPAKCYMRYAGYWVEMCLFKPNGEKLF